MITDPIQEEWFENQVVGRDPLNNAMKLLSERAKLSQMYTNHCIRACVVTKLDEEGFEARHIMVVSSHKCENSIKTYASKCPETKKKEMFEALAQPFVNPSIPFKEQNQNVQKSVVPQQSINTPDQANFQLVDMFPDMEEDPLSNDQFLEAINKIERENMQCVPNQQVNQQPANYNTSGSQITSNYIQNVQNRNNPKPHMFFPHSNVTINYNFNQKCREYSRKVA